jgi:hypothetical protein
MATDRPSAWQITSRIAASLLGGYACTWGFAALGIAGLMTLGMSFGDARTLTMLLAFLVFLAVFCWAYAAASVARVWATLVGSGAAMTLAGWLMSRALI